MRFSGRYGWAGVESKLCAALYYAQSPVGAIAVGIGRPMLWGLGAFGEAGVNRVLEIMQGELTLVMGNGGTQKVADISRDYVSSRDWKS